MIWIHKQGIISQNSKKNRKISNMLIQGQVGPWSQRILIFLSPDLESLGEKTSYMSPLIHSEYWKATMKASTVRGKIMNSGASMDAMTLSMHRCYVTSLEDTRVLYLILCRRHCYWLCETSIIDHFLWVICMYMIWHVLSYLDISLHMPGFSYITGCHWPSAVYSY